MELSNTGFGAAGFDPYDGIVCASLYSEATEELQNVFEGGVQTLRGDTFIAFNNVDFGAVGSDEVNVGIYLNGYEPIPFEITDGEGKILGSYEYLKHPHWNHYQYMICKLNERLRGVKDIRFVFHKQIRFKGFEFIRPTRVGEVIPATSNDGVYGDAFKVEPDCIAEIGNNVTVEYGGFDFGEEGITKITIKGRSHNANDTIHVRFATESGADNQIVEFAGSDEVVTRTFELTKVTGKADLKLVFLPGCRFDLYEILIDR